VDSRPPLSSITPGATPSGWRLEDRLVQADAWVREGSLEQARELLLQCLTQAPDSAAIHSRLKTVYLRLRDWNGLRSELEYGQRSLPSDLAEYERSYLSLLFGEMPKGWDQWEVRLRIPGKVGPPRTFTQPRWTGEPFSDQTLLLHFEQGFGDTFMFLRYAPLVKARGGRVVLLAQKQIAAVAATCPGIDAVIPEGAPLPPFALHLSLPSLPPVFRTDLDSIPCEIPYLDVPEQVPNRQALARLLAKGDGRVRIGCSWAGSPQHKRDKERSIPMKIFGLLAELPDVAWYSFQFGVMNNPPLPGITPLAPALQNFSDTAYALSGMDLVITVDTALAHLAGAMGIPTLLLVHFQPDFRWLLNREDSPWYPTLRIFRQPTPGDWEATLRNVVQELTRAPEAEAQVDL